MIYVATSELGTGAISTVWMAKHKLLKTFFALKVLDEEFLSDIKSKSLFLENARTVSKLPKHPNIIRINNLVDTEEMVAVVMETVEGNTVRQLIGNTQPPGYQTVVHWISKIAAAVKTCHEHQVCQLNLCPSNIMVGKDGIIKCLPNNAFEILKIRFGHGDPLTNLSQSESIAYSPPELFLPGGSVDTASDIYSLGLITYFMVTGKDPFDISENTFAGLQKQVYNAGLHLTGTGWDDFIQKATAKNPTERFRSIDEMLAHIPNESKAQQQVTIPTTHTNSKEAPKPVEANPKISEAPTVMTNPVKPNKSSGKRKNVLMVIGAVVVIAVLSGIGFLLFQEKKPAGQPTSIETSTTKYKCKNADCSNMPLYDTPGGCDLCGRELVAVNGETDIETNVNVAPVESNSSINPNGKVDLGDETASNKPEKKQRLDEPTVDSLDSYRDSDEKTERNRNRSRDKSTVKCSYDRCNNLTSNTNLIYDHPYMPFCSERCRQKFLN